MNAEELCRKLRTAGPPLFECSSAWSAIGSNPCAAPSFASGRC